MFKKQIWKYLQCNNLDSEKINNLQYTKNSFINYFNEYNQCNNTASIDYEKIKPKKDWFNFTAKLHFKKSSLVVQNLSSDINIDFESNNNFTFGIEAEFILPFNKNKWCIVLDPVYQTYISNKTIDSDIYVGGKIVSNITYNSVEFPVGVRHYFFINNSSKIFINAFYINDFTFKSKSILELKRDDNSKISSLEFNGGYNFSFGLGFKLKNKYSLEIRAQSEKNILKDYSNWNSAYNTISILAGYSIF